MMVRRNNTNRNTRIIEIFNRFPVILGSGSEILLSIGIGGLLTFYFIQICKMKLIPYSVELEKIIFSGSLSDFKQSMLEGVIFLISIFALFIAPLLSKWNKKKTVQVFVLLIVIFIDVVAVGTVVVQGQVYPIFIFVIYMSSIYIVWLCNNIIKIIYDWVKLEGESEKFNVVKLTLLWGIMAFLLGRMGK